jgi:hypothetical protein
MCELTSQLAACKVCTAENKRLRDALEEIRALVDRLILEHIVGSGQNVEKTGIRTIVGGP